MMCDCTKDHLCRVAADLHRKHYACHVNQQWDQLIRLRKAYNEHRGAALDLEWGVEVRPHRKPLEECEVMSIVQFSINMKG